MRPERPPFAAGLYAIVDLDTLEAAGARDPVEASRALIRGGCVALQLRAKQRPRRSTRPLAQVLRRLTREASIPLFINDDTKLAAEVDADGVHLGQQDGAVEQARRILRPHQRIGRSTHDLAQVREAAATAVSYLGYGPVYDTHTKAVADPVQGPEALRRACAAVDLPVVAIGGIGLPQAAAVAEAGAHALAAISAVLAAPDMVEAVRRITERFREARQARG
jgi:thiamine-phosphate diphosphorylase